MDDFLQELKNNETFIKFFQENSKKNLIGIFETMMDTFTVTYKRNQDNYFLKNEINDFKHFLNDSINQKFYSMEEKNNQSFYRIANENNQILSKIAEKNNQMLNKLSGSSNKGQVSENLVFYGLNKLFNDAEIQITRKEAGKGDFIIKREGKCDILIENKCYATNIPSKEVEKFERDLIENEIHGILMSQASGIANKSELCLQIKHGRVAIYIPNMNNDLAPLKNLVSMIDIYDDILKNNFDGNVYPTSLDKEMMNKFKEIIEENDETLKKIIEDQKRNTKELERMYLGMKFEKIFGVKTNNEVIQCEKCLKCFKNQQGLGGHKKRCQK